MPESKKREHQRRRKWAPKARSGCRTCKTRHVKCDEAKPICRRCILSGFRCDGYENVENAVNGESDPSTTKPPEEPPKQNSPESESSSSDASTESISPTSATSATSDTSLEIMVNPGTPYRSREQQHAMKFFVDMTASMVGRSKAAPHYWKKLIPQAAWQYPSVRHALMAAATLNESLAKRESLEGRYRIAELSALNHSNLAIKSLLTERVPMDVVLLTSSVFGILDLFSGNWHNACIHINTGARLAKLARKDPNHDPFIAFYAEAFASALPKTLQDDAFTQAGEEINESSRLYEAICSLRLALNSFQEARPKVVLYNGEEKDRMLYVLDVGITEVEWLLSRWETLLDNDPNWADPGDRGPLVNFARVESPFSACMTELNAFLDHGGPFDIARFEVIVERTLPFFVFASALSNVSMREDGAELMYRGAMLRGRQIAPIKEIESPSQKVLEYRSPRRNSTESTQNG